MPTGLGDEKLWLSATNDNTGTSTAFNDQSGEGNDGTANGGMLVVADTDEGGSYAFDFDGSNDQIDLPSSIQSALGTSEQSFSFWMNRDAVTGNGGIIGLGTNASRQMWAFGSFAHDVFYDGSTTGSPVTNTWRHIAGTIDGTNAKVYVDGVLVDTTSATQPIPTGSSTKNYIGYIDGFSRYDGKLDDIRVYDRVLTQAEITHLAEARGIEGPPPVGLGGEQLWYSATLRSDGANLGDYGSTDMQLKPDTTCTIESFDSDGNDCFQSPSRTDNWKTDPNFNIYAEQSDKMTLAAWISSDNLGSTTPLFGLGGDNAFKSYGLIMEQTNTQKGAVSRRTASGTQTTSTSSNFLSSSAVSPTHIAFVYNVTDDSIKFYKDGVLFEDVSTTVLPLSNVAQNTAARFGALVGNSSGGGTNTRFEDMRSFDRELSAGEIAYLASAPNVQGPPPEGLGDEQLWLCPSLNDSANDISGNGNDGTYNGGMGTVTSDGKLAYDFDGTDDYISVLGGVGTGTTDAFCLAFWWNWAGTGSEYVWDMDYAENNSLSVTTKTSPSRLQAVARPNSDGSGNTYMNVGTNSWEHVVYQRVAGSNQIKSYRDGVENAVVRTASDPVTLGNDLTIGAANGGIVSLDGMMDDIRWFNKSLTQAEITHLATSRGIEGPPPVGLGDEQMWFCPSLRADGNDITGSALNEALVGSMAIVSDTQSGGSLAYDTPNGTTGGLTFTPPASTIASGQAASITVAMWADHTSFTTNYLFSTGANSFSDYLFVQGVNNDFIRGSVNGGITGGSEQFTRGNPMQHYVFEFTATTIKTWVNGTLASTVAGTWAGDTWDRGAIGALSRQSLTQGAQCTLDDIRVYGRNLTQAEITHLATSRGIEGSPSTPTTQYNPFISHAFKQLFQQRLR